MSNQTSEVRDGHEVLFLLILLLVLLFFQLSLFLSNRWEMHKLSQSRSQLAEAVLGLLLVLDGRPLIGLMIDGLLALKLTDVSTCRILISLASCRARLSLARGSAICFLHLCLIFLGLLLLLR